MRELLLASHRVIYEVFADRVAVLRIIHTSRNLATIWGRHSER